MKKVISYYALTDATKQNIIAGTPGVVEFEAVSNLRNHGALDTLRKIRQLAADELVVAIEDENARPLAVPLLLVGVLSGSRRITLREPGGTEKPVSRLEIAKSLLKIARMQITARLAFRRAMQEVKRFDKREFAAPLQPAHKTARVLYLDANLSFGVAAGGSLGHIKGVIDALVDAGYGVDYASVKKIPTKKVGARWEKMTPPDLYSYPPELNYYSFNEDYNEFIENISNNIEYSFIYQRMSLHNCSGLKARENLKRPLVLEYNGSEAWTWANWGQKLHLHDAAVALERVSLQNADLVVTVSDALRDEVLKVGVPGERILVYPNCIDPDIFDPARFPADERKELRKQWGIAPDARVATFIGTFGVWHGVDFLASAIKRLVDERRDWLDTHKLHFLLIGDGRKMPEVRETLAGPGYQEFATLTGLVPQNAAPAYLAASDIFLSTHVPNDDGSAFFGSPTKLFEYMAMEKPIVASDLDQIGEVLKGVGRFAGNAPEGPLAELFPPGDELAFIDALVRIVENQSHATRLAQRARRAALDSYTWRHHVDAILDRL